MNYWIFVHTGKGNSAEITFSQLLNRRDWGFSSSPQILNKIKMLNEGDSIIFYIGGPNNQYIAGEAILTSGPHAPTRKSIPEGELDFMVEFDDIDLWEKLYLTKNVRNKLNFIKNKDNWGMSFGQSIIKISDNDYDDIKKLIKYKK